MKYAYREGTTWYLTDKIEDASGSGDVYKVAEKLTTADVELLRHEQEVEDAEKEVHRAEQRRQAAQDRLRIQKLKALP